MILGFHILALDLVFMAIVCLTETIFYVYFPNFEGFSVLLVDFKNFVAAKFKDFYRP